MIGIIHADEPVPTFRWLSERSSSGIQHLEINHGDERHAVILHPYNPVSFEVKSDVDPCIYKGHLMMEPTTEVLVTGGCKGANTFEVRNFSELNMKSNYSTFSRGFLSETYVFQ